MKVFHRAVDKEGNTVDFLLTTKRDKNAALRFLSKAIGRSGTLSLINIDKSGAKQSGIQQCNLKKTTRASRSASANNNVVEQDHRTVKRKVRSMLGFKRFYSAQKTLAGVELDEYAEEGPTKQPPAKAGGLE